MVISVLSTVIFAPFLSMLNLKICQSPFESCGPKGLEVISSPFRSLKSAFSLPPTISAPKNGKFDKYAPEESTKRPFFSKVLKENIRVRSSGGSLMIVFGSFTNDSDVTKDNDFCVERVQPAAGAPSDFKDFNF